MRSSIRGEDVEEAVRLIREAHRLAPDNAAITNSLGWALYLQGQPAGGDSRCSSGAAKASRPMSRSTSIWATPISPPAAGSRRASPGPRRSLMPKASAAARLQRQDRHRNGAAPRRAVIHEIAYAKLNLALHVRERLPDGYHRIETVFAFCEDGDVLTARESDRLTLALTGPFARELAAEPDNLVLRAARAMLGARVGLLARQETAARLGPRRRLGRCGGGAPR